MTPPADDALHALPLPSEDEDAERSNHLHVAPNTALEAARRRRRARLALLGVGAISAASMFGLVAFHVFAVQSSFQLDKLQSQLTIEQRRNGMLRDEVATRSSPETIANRAEGLGMVRPSQVIVLRPTAAKPI